MLYSSCIQPFWTNICLQVEDDWGGDEIITTEVSHTDFVTLEGEQKSPYRGEEHLRPQEVQERVVLMIFIFQNACGAFLKRRMLCGCSPKPLQESEF